MQLEQIEKKHKELGEEIQILKNNDNLPTKWEDLEKVKGWYTDAMSQSCGISGNNDNHMKNTFATKEQAEASIAMAQLSQLMKAYNGDWTADWEDHETKYCIYLAGNKTSIGSYVYTRRFLAFKSEELREKFLENFEDLIIKAKPLL